MTSSSLTPRHRILTALNHHEPDRIPSDLGATFTTGIHKQAYAGLRRALGLPDRSPDIFSVDEQIVIVDEDVAARLQIDTVPLLPSNPDTWQLRFEERQGSSWWTNEFGMTLRMPPGGFYYDIVGNPLREVHTISELKAYPWPDPLNPGRYEGLRQRALDARATGRAVVLNAICAGIAETSAWMCGYERFYADLASDPGFAEYLLDWFAEYKMAWWERALAEIGDLVDIIQEADDLGAQNSPLISPAMYRRIIKPRHKKLFSLIHQRSPAPIFFHSCGAIRPLIPDLIDAGVNILNPIQVSAAGMETAALKRDFGSELAFWGGSVDTQRVLCYGTPQQVRDEARRRIDDLSPGGGFVFAAVHNIQADVPPGNILALWQELGNLSP